MKHEQMKLIDKSLVPLNTLFNNPYVISDLKYKMDIIHRHILTFKDMWRIFTELRLKQSKLDSFGDKEKRIKVNIVRMRG